MQHSGPEQAESTRKMALWRRRKERALKMCAEGKEKRFKCALNEQSWRRQMPLRALMNYRGGGKCHLRALFTCGTVEEMLQPQNNFSGIIFAPREVAAPFSTLITPKYSLVRVSLSYWRTMAKGQI